MQLVQEADPRDTASLRQTAVICERRLRELLDDEEAGPQIVRAKDGHWASRQFAEFNLWCTKVGVHGEGLQSIDVRLKDVPEFCNLLGHLLQSLKRDLNELLQPVESAAQKICDSSSESGGSDALSFDSLSSPNRSETESDLDSAVSMWKRQSSLLQEHIEDTIDRLHGHALQIGNAGASHRRKRIEIYRQKDEHKWAFDGFKQLAMRKAKVQFPLASDSFQERLAESFARRRIRFDYLKKHQKKRAVGMVVQQRDNPPNFTPMLKNSEDRIPSAKNRAVLAEANKSAQNCLRDEHTVYSATVDTEMDIRPQHNQYKRAESVASVALRHPEFPPPPLVLGVSFQCPYCQLEFRAIEAEKDRWSAHVMQDFEPYFCILEDCKAPFDVANTFENLLGHLQGHVEERYHVDTPNGEHKEFTEKEFEEHYAEHGELSEEMLAIMKVASRRKAAFWFEACPFCGGYPDVLERRFPDPDDPKAQNELRRHIKQHMQDVALFLPPYREDTFDRDDEVKSSIGTRRRSACQSEVGEPSDFLTVCNRTECDCKNKGRFPEDSLRALLLQNSVNPDDDVPDIWAEWRAGSPLYDFSPIPDDYFLSDKALQSFIARLKSIPSDQRCGKFEKSSSKSLHFHHTAPKGASEPEQEHVFPPPQLDKQGKPNTQSTLDSNSEQMHRKQSEPRRKDSGEDHLGTRRSMDGSMSLSFLFVVNALRIEFPDAHPGFSSPIPYDQWENALPPSNPVHYAPELQSRVMRFTNGRITDASDCYQWRRDGPYSEGYIVDRISGNLAPKYKSASVFSCNPALPIVTIDGDARIQSQPTYHALRFFHPRDEGTIVSNKVSQVTFSHPYDHGSGAPLLSKIAGHMHYVAGNSASWIPSLVPSIYQNPYQSGQSVGLGGELTILIGLMAFQAPWGQSIEKVFLRSRLWRDYMWRGTDSPSGYTLSVDDTPRGYLVHISFDPSNYASSTEENLSWLEWHSVLIGG